MTWTNNNLYNKFYEKYAKQLDAGNKTLKTTFKLTLKEYMYISNQENKVFFQGQWYRSNEPIMDFNTCDSWPREIELELITTSPPQE